MAGYKGHLVGGFFACLACYAVTRAFSMHYSVMWLAFWIFCGMIGSLFPDIDIKSKGQKLFYRLFLLIAIGIFVTGDMYSLVALLFFALMPLVVRHRGIFHQIWFLLGLCSILLVFSVLYLPHHHIPLGIGIAFFFAGICSHLILDKGIKRTFAFK